jgi:predicted enzyme related to lactoylglutathione lyase
MSHKNPHGKICYIEIPAVDVRRSSEFYESLVGDFGSGVMAPQLSTIPLAQ